MEKKQNKIASVLMNLDIAVCICDPGDPDRPYLPGRDLALYFRRSLHMARGGADFLFSMDRICSGRRRFQDRKPCGHRNDRGSDACEGAEDHGMVHFHRGGGSCRLSVLPEYRLHPGIHKERPFHQHVKDSLYSRIRTCDFFLH